MVTVTVAWSPDRTAVAPVADTWLASENVPLSVAQAQPAGVAGVKVKLDPDTEPKYCAEHPVMQGSAGLVQTLSPEIEARKSDPVHQS
ncbi:hypothetical protein HKX48_000287 [Thoreauomyces humboldtii]|nr:hypothetical protein HKX48_000287 [Thoreauomyces humboldtii]